MNDQLVHIFDNSTCLTKRQLKDYVTGVMGDEECHAAEVHLNSCPFCSDAVDGMMMHKDEAAQLLADLNPDFLKEHFAQAMPQLHLNALAVPATDQPVTGRKKNNTRPLWRTASVAAAVLFCTAIVWYYQSRQEAYHKEQIAQELPANTTIKPAPASPEQKIVATTAATPGKKEPAPAIVRSDAEPLTSTVATNEDERIANKTSVADVQEAAPVNADVKKDGTDAQLSLRDRQLQPAVQANDARPNYGNALTRNQNLAQNYTTNNAYSMSSTGSNSYNASGKFDVYKAKQENVPVAAKRSSQPLLEPSKPSLKEKETEIHNMPANNLNDVAATAPAAYQSKSAEGLNIGGARTEGAGYVIDGVQTSGKKAARADVDKVKKKERNDEDNVLAGDDLYDRKNYKAALSAYSKDLGHSNRGRRHNAMMGAARCYMNLGQKTKAKQLLQSIIDEGGAQGRQAKKMLRKMDGDTQ